MNPNVDMRLDILATLKEKELKVDFETLSKIDGVIGGPVLHIVTNGYTVLTTTLPSRH